MDEPNDSRRNVDFDGSIATYCRSRAFQPIVICRIAESETVAGKGVLGNNVVFDDATVMMMISPKNISLIREAAASMRLKKSNERRNIHDTDDSSCVFGPSLAGLQLAIHKTRHL